MPRHMPDRACEDTEFVDSRDGRVMRIMAEYLAPQKRLREAGIEDTIVFFGPPERQREMMRSARWRPFAIR